MQYNAWLISLLCGDDAMQKNLKSYQSHMEQIGIVNVIYRYFDNGSQRAIRENLKEAYENCSKHNVTIALQ